MILKVKKLSPHAVIPTRAYPGDAGFDLVATSVDYFGRDAYGRYSKVAVEFGFAVEIPAGHVGLIFARSSIYFTRLRLSNAVGVIDAGYRGVLSAVFDIDYDDDDDVGYEVGDRCAQLVILPLPEVEIVEADELTPSERGTGSYGSSGQKGGLA